MISQPTFSMLSPYQNLSILLHRILLLACFLWSFNMTGQSSEKLIGHWQLQKVSFKKMTALNSDNDNKLLLGIFKAALYDRLTDEQQSNLDDLDLVNSEAELLLNNYYQTTMEFKTNSAFYNISPFPDKSFSGEYQLDMKKLLMEWETGDKNNFKILKITANELVLKDTKFKVTYYYTKT